MYVEIDMHRKRIIPCLALAEIPPAIPLPSAMAEIVPGFEDVDFKVNKFAMGNFNFE